MESPAKIHRDQGRAARARCAVLTVSDSRDLDNDPSGDLIQQKLAAAGHQVDQRALIADDIGLIRAHIGAWLDGQQINLILCTGGTGVATRDQTVEAVRPLWQRELSGFGELFRALSFAEIGSAAMLSRAGAGVVNQTAIFLLPGSPNAVELAMDRLIVPEIGHLLGLLRPGDG